MEPYLLAYLLIGFSWSTLASALLWRFRNDPATRAKANAAAGSISAAIALFYLMSLVWPVTLYVTIRRKVRR